MQYVLLIHADGSGFAALPPAEQEKGLAAYGAYHEAMSKAGISKESARLRPPSDSTTVRVVDGKTKVMNGPYADTKEYLGGFFIIDVPDLDAAISWAARCPGASHGTVEVRPIWSM